MKKFYLALTPFILSAAPLPHDKKTHIDLREPRFEHGILSTDKGGVLFSEDLRIQAKSIQYITRHHGKKVERAVAEGDILFAHNGKVFVADRLEYDFETQRGHLENARTSSGIWFISGERVELLPDGRSHIDNAIVSAYATEDPPLSVAAKSIDLDKEWDMKAKSIQFKVGSVPYFWLPALHSNLSFFSKPPLRIKASWDKGLGPRVSVRYRAYSDKQHEIFTRVEYRPNRGWGAALETQSRSKNKCFKLNTNSYASNDKNFKNQEGPKRYRLQGDLLLHTPDEMRRITLCYDKMTDQKMVSDFRSDDFEMNVRKKSALQIDQYGRYANATFRLQPRLNKFQSIGQELPKLSITTRPLPIANSGVSSQSHISAGYLHYRYAHALKDDLPSTKAGRFELRQHFERPTHLSGLLLTPHIGGRAIYYTDGPASHHVWQAIATYGIEASAPLTKKTCHYKHTLTPYANYSGRTHPNSSPKEHYIFNLQDGLMHQNIIRAGVRNELFSRSQCALLPLLTSDIYAYAFFNQDTYRKTIPKGFANLTLRQPYINLSTDIGWNFDQSVVELFNCRLGCTLSESLAFTVEFRHRSQFDWRKSDPENFVIDFSRNLDELLASPLSDKRNTLLTKLDARLGFRWRAHLETKYGWGRMNDKNYFDTKVALSRLIGTFWLAKLTYERQENNHCINFSVKIVN